MKRMKDRLSVQLGMLILTVNLLFLGLCFLFQYVSIGTILQRNYEEAQISRFEQAEYNISNFCDQMELVSRRLSADANIRQISKFTDLSFTDQMLKLNEVNASFKKERNNYAYLQSISFYGDNGLILKNGDVLDNGGISHEENALDDWYYTTEMYVDRDRTDLKLKWFGGYTDRDFGFGKKNAPVYYISAVRNILSGNGQLVFNVQMDYFVDLFYATNKDTAENIYIVNEKGIVIASKRAENIGKEALLESGEEFQPGIRRYEVNTKQGRTQVLVYSLDSLGWSLVSEIPVEEVTKDSVFLRNILLFSCFISIIASFAVSMRWIFGLLKPLNLLVNTIRKVREGKLGYVLENRSRNEIGVVIEEFNRMSTELKTMFDKNQEMEEEKQKLEMQVLRSQLNPHLIYNTLNTIKWMALIDNERSIAEAITLLSDFLEPVFRNKGQMCTVKEELEYVKNYIAIMNLRNAGGYELKVDVPEECMQYQVPRFLLQPVVENSILHGFEQRYSGKIRISMWTEGENAFIRVEDDGTGIETQYLQALKQKLERSELIKGSGVGIGNVNRRIKVRYGEEYGLSISNGSEKGAVVVLKIRLQISE